MVNKNWTSLCKANGLKKIWLKLKRLKVILKRLHKENYNDLDEKVSCARKDLDIVQTLLMDDASNPILHIRGKKILLVGKTNGFMFKKVVCDKWLESSG